VLPAGSPTSPPLLKLLRSRAARSPTCYSLTQECDTCLSGAFLRLGLGEQVRRFRNASANFLRRDRNGGNGLGVVLMYGHTCQPPSESDGYEIGKVAIHYLAIVAMSPRTSSNHAVRTLLLRYRRLGSR
jgi:hypothetical protein